MEFLRQEYRSGLSFPSLEDLPNPGIEPKPSALHANSLPFEPPGKPLVINFPLEFTNPVFLSSTFYTASFQPEYVFKVSLQPSVDPLGISSQQLH